jgi:hypothetical protein
MPRILCPEIVRFECGLIAEPGSNRNFSLMNATVGSNSLVPFRVFDPKRFPEIGALKNSANEFAPTRAHHFPGDKVRCELNEDRFNNLPPARLA